MIDLQRETLAKRESTELIILFPGHLKVGEYEGWLYYTMQEEPSKHIPFYSFKGEIKDASSPLMS